MGPGAGDSSDIFLSKLRGAYRKGVWRLLGRSLGAVLGRSAGSGFPRLVTGPGDEVGEVAGIVRRESHGRLSFWTAVLPFRALGVLAGLDHYACPDTAGRSFLAAP